MRIPRGERNSDTLCTKIHLCAAHKVENLLFSNATARRSVGKSSTSTEGGFVIVGMKDTIMPGKDRSKLEKG